ncbi:type II secretion system F family protein [Vreelandella rituensis]|uniref:Type II secretion system protein GspF domain-containing protein n=1 Tax=Vreelandella rituensis TaxID=2282306 RepID=A0A368U9S6_9GAMM|nr:type II secretion system F family protein [Halomonas rituensis]RCV93870.1 hypothetical protein DU506_01550 [Halomonas rituensis]
MMKRNEIKLSSRLLAGFLAAGMPLSESLERMKLTMPAHKLLWHNGVLSVNDGRALSEVMKEAWPPSLVEVLKAGEQAGQVEEVLRGIYDAQLIEDDVMGQLAKIYYPLGMAFSGMIVGLFFLLQVMPNIAEALGRDKVAGIMLFSLTAKDYVVENLYMLGISIVGTLAAIVFGMTRPGFKPWAQTVILKIPFLNKAIADLRFGLWARYVALCVKSGLGTRESLMITERTLPEPMREAIQRISSDLAKNVALETTVNTDKLDDDDPRKQWLPFFITTAFITAAQTGRLDESLERVSPELIWQGTRRLGQVIFVAQLIAIAMAAGMIVTPMAAMLIEMIASTGRI